MPLQAGAVARIDAMREPVRRQPARDLRTLQHDLRQHGTRYATARRPVGECKHALVEARPLETGCADPDGAALERELSDAVNMLGVGPQGLGGDATAFAVHVELAATHITMNPVAVNMQCHSARRASAHFTETGVTFGF